MKRRYGSIMFTLLMLLGTGVYGQAGTVQVSIADYLYVPEQITVPVGTTVVWTNNDAVAHTVTSDDGIFDSGIFDSGATYQYTFNEVGNYPYFCTLHTWMVGSVVVEGPVNVDEESAAAPETFTVGQNYPNPFNAMTTISFELYQPEDVHLTVYSISGQEVRELVSGPMNAGNHSVVWNGSDDAGVSVATGMYLYRLQAGDTSRMHSMLYLK